MRKVTLIASLLFCAVVSVSAQKKKNPKNWKIIVIGDHFRKAASLQNVTDSSVILLLSKNRVDEIKFTAIRKIKLKMRYAGAAAGGAGFLVEGVAGGVIVGNALSKGKTGEPAAMSGVVGGIGGGILIGIAAAIVNPAIVDILTSKKIFIQHDSVFYQSLKLRLKPYCLIQ